MAETTFRFAAAIWIGPQFVSALLATIQFVLDHQDDTVIAGDGS
jgi:hypothetical protein